MRLETIVALLLAAAFALGAQEPKKKKRASGDGPQPRVVTAAATAAQPPSDAIPLFNGKDMSGWRTASGAPAQCQVADGEISCRTGSGDILSEETFGDAQLHLEFAVPHMPAEKGQRKGNSGVYLHSCYEVQILDSYQNPTYADGSLGAVYGFSAPMVNAARKPGEWQSYDILFRAPRCDTSGSVSEPGRVTILLNGVFVQDHVPVAKKGPGCKLDNICGRGPIRLQDHSGFPGAPLTVMKFRNLWLRKLD